MSKKPDIDDQTEFSLSIDESSRSNINNLKDITPKSIK